MKRRSFLKAILGGVAAAIVPKPVFAAVGKLTPELEVVKLTANKWYHIAIVRTGISTAWYCNQEQVRGIEGIKINPHGISLEEQGSIITFDNSIPERLEDQDFTIEAWVKEVDGEGDPKLFGEIRVSTIARYPENFPPKDALIAAWPDDNTHNALYTFKGE